MKIKKYLRSIQFVAQPHSNLSGICEALAKVEGVSGKLEVQPKAGNEASWATGDLSCHWPNQWIKFICVIGACHIDDSNTVAESEAIRQADGATDTYIMRWNNFQSSTDDLDQITQQCEKIILGFLKKLDAIPFEGFYMRVDCRS